jgi:tetratricopeptide (TPR) repeat protein
MEELDYIDAYFSGELPAEETARFDQRIKEDSGFAETVAFYLASRHLVREEVLAEKKKKFRQLYDGYSADARLLDARRKRVFWMAAASAAVFAGLVFGLFLLWKPSSPSQLADKYIQEHFATLGVTLSSREDSLQDGLRLYNEGRLRDALTRFESMLRADSSNTQAIKYAGIVSLRLQNYDKAIGYFQLLSTHTGLYANPAKFYEAITLLKRNHPGDAATAKQLLQQVANDGLEGKQDAQEWERHF